MLSLKGSSLSVNFLTLLNEVAGEVCYQDSIGVDVLDENDLMLDLQ